MLGGGIGKSDSQSRLHLSDKVQSWDRSHVSWLAVGDSLPYCVSVHILNSCQSNRVFALLIDFLQ